MEFSIKSLAPERAKTGCLVLGVYQGGALTRAAQLADRAARGALRGALALGDLSGKPGSTLLLRGVAGLAAQRVLLVGLGERKEFGEQALRDAVRGAANALRELGAKDAARVPRRAQGRAPQPGLGPAPARARPARGVLPLRPAQDAEEAARAGARRGDAGAERRTGDAAGAGRRSPKPSPPPTARRSRAPWATCRPTSAPRPTWPRRRRSWRASTSSACRCSSGARWKSSAWARCCR